jgi:hypothetical protein
MPELKAPRPLHGGTRSGPGARVKADSRDGGGALAPALTRATGPDTLKPRQGSELRLMVDTVSSEASPQSSDSALQRRCQD